MRLVFLSEKYALGLVFTLYMIGILAFYPFFQYSIGIDGSSYVTIAQNYAAGNFNEAINGIWSPLISWLLVPFILMDIDPLTASKVINGFISCGILLVFKRLLNVFELPYPKWFLIGGISIVPALVYASSYSVNPDLLAVFCLLLYLNQFLQLSNQFSAYFKLGILGAFAYFSKAYCLPLITLHLGIYFVMDCWKQKNKRSVIKNYISAFSVFLAISMIWISVLSQKYSYITYSTAGYYNKSVIQHRIKENLTYYHHPATYNGLVALPNDMAFNAHEELSNYYQGNDKLEYTLIEQLKIYTILIIKNGGRLLILILPFFTLLVFPILIDVGIQLYQTKNTWHNSPLFKVVFFSLLYPLGYLFFFMKIRYVWILQYILVLLGLILLKHIFENYKIKPYQKYGLIGIFIFSNIYGTTFRQPHHYPYTEMNLIIKQLKIPENSRTASDDYWTFFMELNYNLKVKYLGATHDVYKTETDLIKAFKKYNVAYFFVRNPKTNYQFLKDKEEITNGKFKKLKVYKLK